MILYDARVPVSLIEFGIQIPVRDSRATKTFAALCDDPELNRTRTRWHADRVREPLTREDLLRVHSPAYVNRLYSDELEDEIIATYELIDANGRYYRYTPQQAARPLVDLFQRILLKAAGSFQSGCIALTSGFCFYFAGGMHHAHFDYGSGFCLINDVVIAARKLQAEKSVRHVWIVDIDAHKGDGTAALTQGDETIRTLSIHMADSWPLDGPVVRPDGRPNPSFVPSDIDLPIRSGEEKDYLARLALGLQRLARYPTPDLAIVLCGADPYEKDELDSTRPLKLTLEQMMQRDQLVYRFLDERRIPATYLMAGGYGESTWKVYAQFLLWALKQHG